MIDKYFDVYVAKQYSIGELKSSPYSLALEIVEEIF